MAEYLVPTGFKDGDKVTLLDLENKIQQECTFVESDRVNCRECCLTSFCSYVNCDRGYFIPFEK